MRSPVFLADMGTRKQIFSEQQRMFVEERFDRFMRIVDADPQMRFGRDAFSAAVRPGKKPVFTMHPFGAPDYPVERDLCIRGQLLQMSGRAFSLLEYRLRRRSAWSCVEVRKQFLA